MTTDRLNFLQRIWYSIFPGALHGRINGERYRQLFNSLLLHFRPRTVPQRTLKFSLTWGLGGMAVVLVFMLFTTGLILKFAYQPVPDRAYESIVRLQSTVYFGQLIRNIHHWSGNVLLLIAFLHFLRVFFSGAFHSPRQFNWVIGLTIFLCILGSNFTGYLLPWDQLAFWAVTICTGMLEYIPGIGLGMQRLIRGGNRYRTGDPVDLFYPPHGHYSRQSHHSHAVSFLADTQSQRLGDSPCARR